LFTCCGASLNLTLPYFTLLHCWYNPSVVRRSFVSTSQSSPLLLNSKLPRQETHPSPNSHLTKVSPPLPSPNTKQIFRSPTRRQFLPLKPRIFDCSHYRRLDQDTCIVASAVSIIDRSKTLPVSTPDVCYSGSQNDCTPHASTIDRMLRINTFSISTASD
jgi:hypothetical protein